MIDTNIIISMGFFPTKQTRKLRRCITVSHELLICDYVLQELDLVIKRKFPNRAYGMERFFKNLPYELVSTASAKGIPDIPEIRDKKDMPILAAAVRENVDIFLTGDKDFLVLDIEKPKIMTMAEFLEVC